MRFKRLLFVLCMLLSIGIASGGGVVIKTIVIDPGHGGKDPGATGPGKTMEKDVALAVALKLGEQIKANFPDVNIIYTRKTDMFVELHERADMANKAKADLFICVHCNSYPTAQAYGTSTYVLGLHRTEANLEVAKRENGVILLESDHDKNYEFDPNSPEGNIIMTMKQNAFLDQSIDIASKIENQFETTGHRKSLGVKQAGFYVLYKTTMPSILSEIGFVSNPEEEKFLASAKGQEQLATSLFNAFKAYKYEMENHPPEPPSAETTHVEAPVKGKDTLPLEAPPVKPEVKQPVQQAVTKKIDTPAVQPHVVQTPVAQPPIVQAPKQDTDVTTFATLSGRRIKKPIENSNGGGIAPEPVPEPTETKTSPEVVSPPPKEVVKPTPPPKHEPVTKQPEPETRVEPAGVTDARIPPHTIEKGYVFKVQLFAIKGRPKKADYDLITKVFTTLSQQTLESGTIRYFAGDEKHFAAAEKLKKTAVSNGYKDAFIVGFKDGKRLSPSELSAAESQ